MTFKSDIQIIYNLEFKSDSTRNIKNNEILGLYIGDKQSIFQAEKKYKLDSIIENQKVLILPNRPMFRVNSVIFKDLKKSEVIFTEEVDKIVFGYEEPIQMKWELLNDKKTILTYNCHNARTSFRGRNYTVWYTKDIAIPDGPYKFAGLPGLILEVYDDQENFHYKLLQIIRRPQEILYNKAIHFTDRKKIIESKINYAQKNSKEVVHFNPIEKN
nr:GLPGLI family protein [Chryseobacterium sp. T16E-39]